MSRENMILKITSSKFIDNIHSDVLLEIRNAPDEIIEKVYRMCSEANKAYNNLGSKMEWTIALAIRRCRSIKDIPDVIDMLRSLSEYKKVI